MLKTIIFFIASFCCYTISAQEIDVNKQLKDFDEYMSKTLKDWNTPGACVGIVIKNKLVFAKGYGYRDYEKKLPVTANSLYQIASNTKLFTTIATGLLVDQGKLDWDKPIKNYVPSIQFYNDELTNTVTIRDMLSHRTGISRHDLIWYKSDFSRKELFGKLKYLEPSQPMRQGFLYNNLMYAASGYITELLSGKTWEDFVRENIFTPLNMNSTVFSIEDMIKQADYGVPYNEKRDTNILYRIPFYEEIGGLGPAGSIISNVSDMSHWLIALMNEGKYEGKQVIPPAALDASLEPAIPTTNFWLEKGYKEILNPVYGMGRWSSSYRGHLMVFHGGDLPGFHSQVSYMPQDSIGVIVFVIGDQSAPLYNVISYNVYERLLNLDLTPWSDRVLMDVKAGKEEGKKARAKTGIGRITGTKPSHPIEDYVGQFGNPAYGTINIAMKDTGLQFALHKIVLPLNHYHYDRFDTPNDEEVGLYSVNFYNNPQGDIDRMAISLDEKEATFVRMPDTSLSNPATLATYTGKYEYAGYPIEVIIKNENQLFISAPGQPLMHLIPYKPRIFHTKEFADYTFEFIIENGQVTVLKQKDPSGEYEIKKK